MSKGEIACFEQFHLLSQYFQKLSAAEASESVCMWERVNNQIVLKTVAKGEIAHVFKTGLLRRRLYI